MTWLVVLDVAEVVPVSIIDLHTLIPGESYCIRCINVWPNITPRPPVLARCLVARHNLLQYSDA